MKARVAVVLLLAGCLPQVLRPKALQEDLRRLESLAQTADNVHARSCTPPPADPFPPSTPGGEPPPPARPAVCGAIETCVSEITQAAHACRDAIRAGAERQSLDTYRGYAMDCREARDKARQTCVNAKLEVPPWP